MNIRGFGRYSAAGDRTSRTQNSRYTVPITDIFERY